MRDCIEGQIRAQLLQSCDPATDVARVPQLERRRSLSGSNILHFLLARARARLRTFRGRIVTAPE